MAVNYQLEPGAGCLLAKDLLHFNICYALRQSSEDKCSSLLLNTIDNTTCISIGNEKGQLSLPRYQTFCVVAKIWSDVLGMNVSARNLTILANEGIPSQAPSNLQISPESNTLHISWSNLTNNWHGLPYMYNVTIYTAGRMLNSTAVPAKSTFLVYRDYNSSLLYNVTISACTRVGCGPVVNKPFPSKQLFMPYF